MIELHNGNLSYNGWEKVIYRGNEYNAPVQISVLMAFDVIIKELKSRNKRQS